MSSGTLIPGFDSLVTNYEMTVPFTTAEITLTAVPSDPAATLQVFEDASRTVLSICPVPEGLDFNSVDGAPVELVFTLIGPPETGPAPAGAGSARTGTPPMSRTIASCS